ncbi:hypothetical protein DL768_004258 [Monosporascus sp. mg162]|nr:hypothetical protein DL768_004258 [Monosporascus sp. mg162]
MMAALLRLLRGHRTRGKDASGDHGGDGADGAANEDGKCSGGAQDAKTKTAEENRTVEDDLVEGYTIAEGAP